MIKIKTTTDGMVATVNYVLEKTPRGWFEIEKTELDELPDLDGHNKVIYYKPEAEEPEDGWDEETDHLGAVYEEIEEEEEDDDEDA